MDTQKIREIATEICPQVDFDKETGLIDNGILDSLQIMQLIMTFCEEFDIEIDGDDIVPENFNSLDAMCALVSKKLGA